MHQALIVYKISYILHYLVRQLQDATTEPPAPTTAQPTTAAPTTSGPTTLTPTTAAPTSSTPTTSAPIPTTVDPTAPTTPVPTEPDDDSYSKQNLTIIIVFSSIGVIAVIAIAVAGIYYQRRRRAALDAAYGYNRIE